MGSLTIGDPNLSGHGRYYWRRRRRDEEIAGRLANILTSEAVKCVSSDLALAELLVGAWRPSRKEEWLAAAYERLFSGGETLSSVPVERRLLIQAAKLRAANLALKLPDAIQLATALTADCELMLSNDRKLLRSAREYGLSTCSLKVLDLDALLARISSVL